MWVFGEVAHVGFSVVVVSDDAAVGEEEDGDGNEDGACAAYLGLECELCEVDAVEGWVGVESAEKDDEGCA